MKTIVMMLALAGIGFGSVALADGDTSADTDAFAQKVMETKSLMIRVPIDKDGRENTDLAELRLVPNGIEASTDMDLPEIWEASEDATDTPVWDQDSSTSGWYSWRYYGWRQPYYYYGYSPYYYYGGRYYYYSTYRYYSAYNAYSPYYGYRYYYYNCYY